MSDDDLRAIQARAPSGAVRPGRLQLIMQNRIVSAPLHTQQRSRRYCSKVEPDPGAAAHTGRLLAVGVRPEHVHTDVLAAS